MNKYLIAILSMILAAGTLMAQSEGSIVYTETIKLDIQIEGLDKAMLDMIPKSQSLQRELVFNSAESVYQNVVGEALEDIDMSSDDGSFQIKIMQDETEDIFYKNIAEKTKTHQKGIMGKTFIVNDALEMPKWKITNEKIKYLDYECQKAVIEDGDRFVVAWFTSQIPTQAGPASLHGLPGTILLVNVNDGESEIKAQTVTLRTLDTKEISQPKNGKKVTETEFEEIRMQKEKEMEEQYGGGRQRIRH